MLKLTIIGHIGQDAIIKDFGGKKYIAFSVAHSESYTDKGGVKVEKTQWVSCLKYGESAVLPYLKKGTKVYVEGSLSTKVFDKNGHPEAALNCNVSHLELLGTKPEQPTQGTHSTTGNANQAPAELPAAFGDPNKGEDLPF